MSEQVRWTTPEASIEEVSRMMAEDGCGEIPVLQSHDQRTVVGVITDRDIVCRSLGQGKNPMELKAKDLMTSQVVMAHNDSPVNDVIALMRDNHIRRVPIVNEKNELSGIVSEADIFRASNEQELSEFVHEYIKPAAQEAPVAQQSSEQQIQ